MDYRGTNDTNVTFQAGLDQIHARIAILQLSVENEILEMMGGNPSSAILQLEYHELMEFRKTKLTNLEIRLHTLTMALSQWVHNTSRAGKPILNNETVAHSKEILAVISGRIDKLAAPDLERHLPDTEELYHNPDELYHVPDATSPVSKSSARAIHIVSNALQVLLSPPQIEKSYVVRGSEDDVKSIESSRKSADASNIVSLDVSSTSGSSNFFGRISTAFRFGRRNVSGSSKISRSNVSDVDDNGPGELSP
jgi:hypothetical protein